MNKNYLEFNFTIYYPKGINNKKADDIVDRFLDIIEEDEDAQAAGGYKLQSEDDYG